MRSAAPDGGLKKTGTMTVKGGTGTFRKAAGSFKIIGDSPHNPDVPKGFIGHLNINANLTY